MSDLTQTPDESTSTGRHRTVVVKNYDARRKIVAVGVVPLLLLASLVVAIPVVLLTALPAMLQSGGADFTVSITVGIVTTLLAELLLLASAAPYVGAFLVEGVSKPRFIERLKAASSFLYLNKFRWRYVLFGVGLGLLAYGGLQLLALGSAALGSPVESSDTSAQVAALSGLELFLVVIGGVSLVVPLVEEIIFRGLVIGSLQRSSWRAPWVAILVSAVSFGIMHFQGFETLTDYAIVVWIGLIGAAFAWATLKTQSLYVAIFGHIVYNGVSGVLILTGIGA